MKARILLLAAGIASLTSCSSLYKTGQTPDDVYYSPARPVAEYVQNNKDDQYDGYQSYQQYQDSYRNDRFLRLSMSMGSPYYMSVYNDYGGFDWRSNAYAYYGNSPWNNYWAWNNFYNPYAYSYCSVPIGYGYGYGYGYGGYGGAYGGYNKISFSAPVSKPVAFSGASYSRPSGTRYISGSNGSYYNNNRGTQSTQRYNNSNSGTQYNNYSNNSTNSSSSNQSNNNNNTSTPTRSYTPAPSSSSSGSSGGGGGGGGVSRPTRQ